MAMLRLPIWHHARQPEMLDENSYRLWQHRIAKHREYVKSVHSETDMSRYEREVAELHKISSGHKRGRRFKREEEEAELRRNNARLVQKICDVARQSEKRQIQIASVAQRDSSDASAQEKRRRREQKALDLENAALLRRLENVKSELPLAVQSARNHDRHLANAARMSRFRRPVNAITRQPLPPRRPRPRSDSPRPKSENVSKSEALRLPPIRSPARAAVSSNRRIIEAEQTKTAHAPTGESASASAVTDAIAPPDDDVKAVAQGPDDDVKAVPEAPKEVVADWTSSPTPYGADGRESQSSERCTSPVAPIWTPETSKIATSPVLHRTAERQSPEPCHVQQEPLCTPEPRATASQTPVQVPASSPMEWESELPAEGETAGVPEEAGATAAAAASSSRSSFRDDGAQSVRSSVHDNNSQAEVGDEQPARIQTDHDNSSQSVKSSLHENSCQSEVSQGSQADDDISDHAVVSVHSEESDAREDNALVQKQEQPPDHTGGGSAASATGADTGVHSGAAASVHAAADPTRGSDKQADTESESSFYEEPAEEEDSFVRDVADPGEELDSPDAEGDNCASESFASDFEEEDEDDASDEEPPWRSTSSDPSG
mmetsp:Transcript_78515/g.139237  ORF Transcript_78515/g.139237 Transcript_78515/m.139237 type:complete len:605 (-) Transcript_78515:47-1861(-)